MSIIQRIRDKAAAIVFVAIALSLIAFILQDAFVGSGRGGGVLRSLKDKIGSVNGSGIEYKSYSEKVNFYEETQKRGGQSVSNEARQQLYDGVWEEFVTNKLLTPLCTDLGITVTTKEVNEELYGQRPAPFMQQLFSDPNTGQYNASAAREFVKNMKKRRDVDPFYIQYIDNGIQQQVINGGMQRKYIALLVGAAYYPKWLADKENADNNTLANFSYTSIPYSSISDSAIKVTDAEIEEYIQKHKDDFKQEKSAELSYVVFDASPTREDTVKIYNEISAIKPKFTTDTNAAVFLSLNNSETQFYDNYLGKSKIQVPMKDSIFLLQKNQVFGPYLDANRQSNTGSFVLAKMLDSKIMPDSARAKHILIQTTNPQSGQVLLEDSIAKKRIDSIVLAIQRGAIFDSLARKFSDDNKGPDGGSAAKGGDLGWFTQGTMVAAFNDFCFNGKRGERKVVKTEFGYHYIEITDQKSFEPFYKIAYFSQRIDPSAETISKANVEATSFAAESSSRKLFEENAKKKGLTISPAVITEKDYSIPGLGYGRSMVKWAFENAEGKVSEPETFGDKYIVAVITARRAEGTQDAKTARPLVEGLIRNKKKAAQIIKKLGSNGDLNAIAVANNTTVLKADSIGFQLSFIPNIGPEGKVVGAVFAKQNLNKTSNPIAGINGIYVIKTEQVFTKPNTTDYKVLRQQVEGGMKNLFAYRSVETLKKTATIKDKRIKFF
ncbi:MAG TPA: peptidylprolyl isomerase [Chitinophagaceae bacterium]|nr:peptidylprolyl isomerase [Chitinophagaceae bacterium]